MGFIANVPLRIGERTVWPGEDVPVEKGRNYNMLLRLGHVTLTREERKSKRPARSAADSE